MTDHAHPAPLRRSINFPLLAFLLIATPSIWGLRLVVNYAIDSHFCFPGAQRSNVLPPWAWPTLFALDLLSLVVAFAAVLVSLASWRRTAHESSAANGPLIEIGEGRTRFLSLWGLLIGVGFIVALVFDLVTLWITPTCG